MPLQAEDVSLLLALSIDWGMRVLAALLIFILGRWVAAHATRLFRRLLTARKADPALVGFLGSMLYWTLLVMVVLSAIDQLGVKTTSFIAILGAAGLAIGLALQGSLSNFASGVLIMIFRPFRVGDFIEAGGTSGIVEEVGILFTHMRSGDNKQIILPNSKVMADKIVNFSSKGTRRMDLVFGISYNDNVAQAKQILHDLLAADARVLKDPAPTIGLLEFGESSVNLACRPWVTSANYWPVYWELMEAVKRRFEEEGISIPFPQRDVHIHQASSVPPPASS